jgi:beta-N-acetylhexosaminidase
MTDQEGGSVVRYKQPENTPPSANKATQLGLDKFTAIMNDVSKSFAKTCINTNLAPIADTDREAKIIRSYSENPSEVNQYASIFATSMRNNGITPTWKHFPGLSSEVENMKKNDSHFKANFKDDFKEALIDTSSKADIEKNMQSFKNNNYDLLMVNSAVFTSYGNTPSILNQEIINQAKIIQPNSLIISDDISFLKLNDEQVLFIFRNVDYIMFTDYRNSVLFINELEKLKDKKLITQHDIYEKQNKINKWRNYHK